MQDALLEAAEAEAGGEGGGEGGGGGGGLTFENFRRLVTVPSNESMASLDAFDSRLAGRDSLDLGGGSNDGSPPRLPPVVETTRSGAGW